MDINKISIKRLAFLQALGLVIYVGLVATLLSYGEMLFGKFGPYVGPVLILVLLVLSVLICGVLTLWQSLYLFWEKRYKEAFTLLGWTICWIFIYWILIAIVITIIK